MTLKISARALVPSAPSAPERNTEYSRKVAKLVLVATPEMPEIEMCAPRVPSRKSALMNIGTPSRPVPIGTRRSIRSKCSAASRAAPVARCTTAPGVGGT